MSEQQLRIFYDGQCPLCVREMRQLAELDSGERLGFIDIQRDDLAEAYPDIDPRQASLILHALDAHGRLLLGLDVTVAAWSLVGKGRRVAWLRWPLIRPLADRFYLLFARNRYRISWLLTGQSRCRRCEDPRQCQL